MGKRNRSDPVAKGPVTYCLDHLSTKDDACHALTELSDEIKNDAPEFLHLVDVIDRKLFVPCGMPGDERLEITKYLRDYWFNEVSPDNEVSPEAEFRHFQPIAPIYANGLLIGLNASLKDCPMKNKICINGGMPKPIAAYWTIGHSAVEVITLDTPQQVTILIATPTPEKIAPAGIGSKTAGEVFVSTKRSGLVAEEIDPLTNMPKKPPTKAGARYFSYKITAVPK
jgi:hypothetical protein